MSFSFGGGSRGVGGIGYYVLVWHFKSNLFLRYIWHHHFSYRIEDFPELLIIFGLEFVDRCFKSQFVI